MTEQEFEDPVDHAEHDNSEPDPRDDDVIVLSNGALYSRTKGHIVKGASEEHLEEMREKRWREYRASLEAGVAEGTQSTTSTDGVRKVMRAVSETAIDREHKDHLRAAREVMDRMAQDAEPVRQGAQVQMMNFFGDTDPQALRSIVQALREAGRLRDEQRTRDDPD